MPFVRAPARPHDAAHRGSLRGRDRGALAPADDALAKADGEGYPDREEVAGWTERVKSVVLHQRDRGRLRADIPALAERLLRLLMRVGVPEGFDPESVVARFVARLPEVRRRIAEDVEAAFEGDPAAKSFDEIVVSYPVDRGDRHPPPRARALSSACR